VTQVDIDGNAYGAVRVFIPELMMEGLEPSYGTPNYGIYAYPANNMMGGYNPEDSGANFAGSFIVPLKGSWVRVKFENGDPSQCFYTGAFNFKHSEVAPENKGVAEPHKVYTIAKAQSGRSFVICDSDDQARVEISGKKRTLSGSGAGSGGVYNVAGNMNTILIDERGGKEKILISSYKGDYIHLDIDQRMIQIFSLNDIRVATLGKLQITAVGGVVLSAGTISLEATGGDMEMTTNGNVRMTQSGTMNIKAGDNINLDGANTFIQSGRAEETSPSPPIPPLGFRGT
jgi:hypothetical protein